MMIDEKLSIIWAMTKAETTMLSATVISYEHFHSITSSSCNTSRTTAELSGHNYSKYYGRQIQSSSSFQTSRHGVNHQARNLIDNFALPLHTHTIAHCMDCIWTWLGKIGCGSMVTLYNCPLHFSFRTFWISGQAICWCLIYRFVPSRRKDTENQENTF